MRKNEKKALFKAYTDALNVVCDKKDMIDKMIYQKATEKDLALHYDDLENKQRFASGIYMSLCVLGLDKEYYEFNW